MVNSIIASMALFGASVSAVGSAIVVNKCSYDVYTCVTPAQGGGQQQQDVTLAPGGTWNQEWTSLTNGAGWSIKFSHDEGSFGENILQYEYTYQNAATIWYDLSCVNGNPWDGNWMITSSTADCNPKQQAYRYATDDAYGMQSCNADASITVTLCSGEDNPNNSSESGDSEAAAAVSSAPAYSAPAAFPTTLSTVVSAPPAVVVTQTVVQTAAVVVGADGIVHVEKRHQHQHHPHGHQQ